MKTLTSLNLGTSLVAATVTAATVIAVAPAQAAVLNGSLALTGFFEDAGIDATNGAFTWTFGNNNTVLSSTGDFANLDISTQPTISDLNFSNCDSNGFLSTCDTDRVTPFIQFGEQTLTTTDGEITADLSFNLDAGQAVQIGTNSSGIIFLETEAGIPGLTGAFVFNGETLATGNLTGNLDVVSKEYTLSLSTKQVPEPLTTLGTGLALGFGGLFQRKNASKRKNKKQA